MRTKCFKKIQKQPHSGGKEGIMRYPKLKEIKTSREMLDIFRGYHHALRIGDGEFYEMENLTSDHYPLLAPRGQRGVYASPAIAQGMLARDTVCHVDGGDLVTGDTRIPMGLSVDGELKTLVSMGNYVIIMPDKKYINMEDHSDRGEMEAHKETESETVFTHCDFEGNVLESVVVSPDEPTEAADRDYWADISQNPPVLWQYMMATSSWARVIPSYVRITSPGIGIPFSVGDGVKISGATEDFIGHLNTTAIIRAKGDDYIVIREALGPTVTQQNPVRISRCVPDMDFIIESENRLWGCRYGTDAQGRTVNRIYGCKRGDFRNWNYFAGESVDSCEISVGSDGAFTGAVTHLGYPLFFKENYLHKVYGSNAFNYQVQTTRLRGVQSGCSRSLASVNEILYYKSCAGVCAYDGSLPEEISAALGDIAYGNAAAGAVGNKYYISMSDGAGNYHLFVYDTRKKMWHREDGTEAKMFCTCGSELYYIDRATNRIMTVRGTGVREGEPFRWSATSGIIGTDSPDRKYISRLDVRMQLEVGTRVAFFAEYDSSGEYEYLFTMTGRNLRSFSVPVRPKRCDHLRLRIVGMGGAKVFSICKTVECGSEIP